MPGRAATPREMETRVSTDRIDLKSAVLCEAYRGTPPGYRRALPFRQVNLGRFVELPERREPSTKFSRFQSRASGRTENW